MLCSQRQRLGSGSPKILAAAMTGKADWLITLDQHFLQPELNSLPGLITGTPGEFMQKVFP